MIYTVKINENTPNGKRIVEELRNNYKDVEFVDSTVNSVILEGYMTGDEFRKNVKSRIYKHYQENSLI